VRVRRVVRTWRSRWRGDSREDSRDRSVKGARVGGCREHGVRDDGRDSRGES
jgi:hypothetical protein